MSPADGCRRDGRRHETSPRRKAVLFCPDCGQEGLVDGDWRAADDLVSRTRHLTCPACAATLTQRPLPQDSLAVRSSTTTAVLRDNWRPWLNLWLSTLSVWLRPRRDDATGRPNC